jgi:hypothetical protein
MRVKSIRMVEWEGLGRMKVKSEIGKVTVSATHLGGNFSGIMDVKVSERPGSLPFVKTSLAGGFMRARSFLSVLAVVVLFVSSVVWVSRVSAQTSKPQPPGPIESLFSGKPKVVNEFSLPAQPETKILSGPDVGIRVTGVRNGQVYGTLVVRVDGKWSAVQTLGPTTYIRQ